MSNYVHRKVRPLVLIVAVALKSEEQEFNQNILLLLKSLLFSVDKINNPLFDTSRSARKSRQEIVRKLFYATITRSFAQWKSAVPSLNEQEDDGSGGGLEQLSAGIERIETKVTGMSVRLAKVCKRLSLVEKRRSETDINEEIMKRMQEQIASMAHMMELMCQQQFGASAVDPAIQQEEYLSRATRKSPAPNLVEEANQRLTTGYILVDKLSEPRAGSSSRAILRDPKAAEIQLKDRNGGSRSTSRRERPEPPPRTLENSVAA
eukprot:768058-Hanusia_phi.AAC.3